MQETDRETTSPHWTTSATLASLLHAHHARTPTNPTTCVSKLAPPRRETSSPARDKAPDAPRRHVTLLRPIRERLASHRVWAGACRPGEGGRGCRRAARTGTWPSPRCRSTVRSAASPPSPLLSPPSPPSAGPALASRP